MKENIENVENIENLPVDVETISSDDLREIVYKNSSLPQDSRFLPVDQGGVFAYFYPRELNSVFNGEEFYQVVKIGDLIVGLSQLQKDPYKEDNYWIKFISVDPLYQKKGYAKKLAEEIVRFAKSRNYSLEHSTFSEQGKERISGLVDSIAEKEEVKILK